MHVLNIYIITEFRLQYQASMDPSFSFQTKIFDFEKRSKFRKFSNFKPALIFKFFGILKNAFQHQIKGHSDSYMLQGFSKIPKFSCGFEFVSGGIGLKSEKLVSRTYTFEILTPKGGFK